MQKILTNSMHMATRLPTQPLICYNIHLLSLLSVLLQLLQVSQADADHLAHEDVK